jgi:very-short-patch-repair endonuclease
MADKTKPDEGKKKKVRKDVLVAAVAVEQHSLVTNSQCQESGLTKGQIRFRARAGGFSRVHQSVYRMPGVAPTYEQRVLAACLATGGVASHRSAARLFGLRGFGVEERVEISVPSRRATKLEGVVAHTSNLLETTFVGEIPVALPAQMLLGLAQVAPGRAEAAVNDVLVKGMATLPALVRFAERQSARGRGGIVLLRELLEEQVQAGAPTESWLEDQVVEFLRQRGFPPPLRQYWVGRRRLDLAWPERRVNFEADGRLWHTSPADKRRDAARDAALAALGWRVERIRWLEMQDPDGLEARLWRCYGLAAAA